MYKPNLKISWPEVSQKGNIFYIRSGGLSTSTVSYWYRAGSRYAPANKQGLPHLVEHLLFQNNPLGSGAKNFFLREALGIESNAFTGFELCHFYHNQLPTVLKKSAKLLEKTVLKPHFSERVLRIEKKVVRHEMNERSESHRDQLWQLSQKALFNRSSLANTIFGTRATVASMTLRECVAFYHTYFREPFIFYCAGERIALTEGKKHPVPAALSNYSIQQQRIKPIPFHRKKIFGAQSSLAISFQTASAPELRKRAATAILRDVLTNLWSSRCNIELRIKKGLVYWVDGTMETFSDRGKLTISTSCKPEHASVVLQKINDQCSGVAKELISASELEKIKKIITFGVVSNMQNSYALTAWYAPEIILHTGLTMELYISLINDISRHEIRTIAAEFFKEANRSIVLIG